MTAIMDWRGRAGESWAGEWRRTDRSFAGLAPALDAAIVRHAPETGVAVDIGTGAGQTAAALASARPGLRVVGIDISDDLVAAASARHDLANLRFVAGDAAEQASALAPVDLHVSRHGVMFFADPAATFRALRASARDGAGLVFSCFAPRAANEWALLLDSALGNGGAPQAYVPGPFAFGDPAFVADLLAAAGWRADAPRPVDYPYIAGEGADDTAAIEDALSFFSRIGPAAAVLAAQPETERAVLLARLRAALTPYARNGQIAPPARAWIWTAVAGEAA